MNKELWSTCNPIYIGITGYKQSGKDTTATQLCSNIFSCNLTLDSFAVGVYEKVSEAFGLTTLQLMERKKHPLVRHILQWAGTEDGRNVQGENIWIDKLEERCLHKAGKVRPSRLLCIITDCRFLNEAKWIREQNGSIIRVERAGQVNNDTHASEQEVDKILADWTIHNDGKNLSALNRDCRFIAQHIKERYGI